MKKLLTSIFAIALIGLVFNSCKKDDETVLDNSITIEGTFTIGDKTFTNPTFDLGKADEHEGYVRPNYQDLKSVVPNMIKIQPIEEGIDVENDFWLEYDYYVYSDSPGTDIESEAYLSIYQPIAVKSSGDGLWLYCGNLKTTITKVGEVGDYIEGTLEGTFSLSKKAETTYPVKGKFKVKRIAYEELNKR